VLLDGSPGERDQPANGGIRSEALDTIDDLRALLHKECGRIVSCADITVLAARDAVSLVISTTLSLLFYFILFSLLIYIYPKIIPSLSFFYFQFFTLIIYFMTWLNVDY